MNFWADSLPTSLLYISILLVPTLTIPESVSYEEEDTCVSYDVDHTRKSKQLQLDMKKGQKRLANILMASSSVNMIV